MGFESSEMARKRLGSWVTSDDAVWRALVPDAPPPPPARQLDTLVREVLTVDGAAGALYLALAAQTRALRLVWEAERRGVGALPADVVAAVRSAITQAPHGWLGGRNGRS